MEFKIPKLKWLFIFCLSNALFNIVVVILKNKDVGLFNIVNLSLAISYCFVSYFMLIKKNGNG